MGITKSSWKIISFFWSRTNKFDDFFNLFGLYFKHFCHSFPSKTREPWKTTEKQNYAQGLYFIFEVLFFIIFSNLTKRVSHKKVDKTQKWLLRKKVTVWVQLSWYSRILTDSCGSYFIQVSQIYSYICGFFIKSQYLALWIFLWDIKD